MKMHFLASVFGFFLLVLQTHASAAIAGPALSDQQITQAIIEQSIASYSGNCPCPYNTDRAGRSCGRRSAYSKPGGYDPLCYTQDVTAQMIEDYRQQQNSRK